MNKDCKIFYTDDDEDDIYFFSDAVNLIEKKIILQTQRSADELINSLQNSDTLPQVVFIDLNMPGKNGFDALTEIRQIARFKTLPIIIFSTSNTDTSIDVARMLGASMYMTKPNSFIKLQEAISFVIDLDWTEISTNTELFVYREMV